MTLNGNYYFASCLLTLIVSVLHCLLHFVVYTLCSYLHLISWVYLQVYQSLHIHTKNGVRCTIQNYHTP